MSNPESVVTSPVPAVTPTPDAPAPSGQASRGDLLAKINAAMRGETVESVRADKRAKAEPEVFSEPASAGADASDTDNQPETVPETATPAPAEGGEVPAKAEGESEKAYAHRIAAAKLATQNAEKKALAAEARAKDSETKLAELTAKLEKASKNPKDALALAGLTPLQFAEAMRDGTITAEDAAEVKQTLDPEVAAMLEEHRAAKAKAAADEKRAAEAAVYKENLDLVTKAIQEPAFMADFPAILGVENGAAFMLKFIQQEMDANDGVEPDFRAVAKVYNEEIVKESTKIVTHAPTLKVLLGNPDVKAAILKELGLSDKGKATAKPASATEEEQSDEAVPQPSKASKGKTVTNKVASKVPSRAAKAPTTADLVARIRSEVFGK